MHANKKTTTSAKPLVLSALAFALCAGAAHAAPVTQWGFETQTTFTAASFENKPSGWFNPDRGQTKRTASEISWGNKNANFQRPTNNASNNRSALTIGKGSTGNQRTGGGAVTGTVNTAIDNAPGTNPGEIALGNSLTHWNNAISGDFNTLLGGSAQATLTLKALTPDYYDSGAPIAVETLVFDFSFYETPNSGDGRGLCVDGVRASQYAGGCPDLFGFPATTLNKSFELFDPVDDILRTYYAHLFVFDETGAASPIQQLGGGECRALGLDEGCLGFRTAEGKATTAQFAFAVTTERISLGDEDPEQPSDPQQPGNQVPEPGSLALMALGLAGLRMLRRQR